MIFQEEPPRDIRQTSYQMQIDNEFTDVTLVTRDGKSIRAHKLILSAASPLLKRMIMDQNINAIYMWDVSNSIMESLIRYMYLGEVTVHQGECTHFCNIAESLELMVNCRSLMMKILLLMVKKPVTLKKFSILLMKKIWIQIQIQKECKKKPGRLKSLRILSLMMIWMQRQKQ